MAKQTVSAPGGGNTLVLGQRYELVPGNRLPELDSPHAEAFGVSNLKTTDPPHFALLSHGGVLPRVEVLESFARADRGPLLRPVEWRAVPWGPAGGYRYAIVFRRPSGRRVLTGGEANFQPWRPDIIVRHVIRPLLPLLKDLSERGLTHRAIRAENLFYADGESGSVVLGECVSAPPGLAQDAIYESIENGMAEPEGRNDGRPGDDLYAFGVLLLVLLTGGNPCAGMTAAEIVAAKLKRGAYGALVGRTKVPINMMEPLRGLLCDDPAERWHVEDLELWLGGRTLTPKQPSLPPKATRPFRFAGEECWDMRSLAHAMAHNWSEAAQALKGRQIVEWVQRSLSQEARAEAIDDALRLAPSASGEGGGRDDRCVARVLMLLDPLAPLRYQELAVRIDSLGRALALRLRDSEWLGRFDSVMRHLLPIAWFDAQLSSGPELLLLRKEAELAAATFVQNGPGMGMERCLYMLNPECPCMSPLLDKAYVAKLDELLPALERVAQQGAPARDPVDRHVAAYCGAQLKHLPDRLLNSLTHSDPAQKSLAVARLLSEVQRVTGPVQLPGLASWLAGRLAPMIETFHYRPYRKKIGADTERAVARGVIAELCALYDSEATRQADQQGFEYARFEHSQAEQEIAWLEQGGLTGQVNVLRGSRQAAAVVSAVASGLMLVVLAMVRLL